MLDRLGTACARHPKRVVLAWLAVLVAIIVAASMAGGTTRDDFSIPGSSAQTGLDLLTANAPALAGTSAQLVFQAPPGQKVTDPAAQAVITQSLATAQKLPGVAANGVSNPFADATATLYPGLKPDQPIPGTDIPAAKVFPATVSPDGTIAYAGVNYSVASGDLDPNAYKGLDEALAPARAAGLTAVVGGAVADLQNPPTSVLSENADKIGLVFAVIILLLSLGTVTGMFVPIAMALFSLTVASATTTVLERFVTIGSVGPALGTMMGLGVGIDYSLFILSRFRQNLGEGQDVPTAVGGSLRSSGSAVLFAGVTVCLALIGLNLIGVPYIGNVGFVGALYVVVTVIAALTLLPAVLGWFGHRVDSLRLPWHTPADQQTPEKLAHTVSARWAREVAKRKWIFAGLSLALLLLLASPVRSIRLGMTSDGDAPAGISQRVAYDLVTDGFGPGQNGPLFVVLDMPTPSSPPAKPIALPAASTPTAAGTPATTAAPTGAETAAKTTAETAAADPLLPTELKVLGALVADPGVKSATPLPLTNPEIAVLAVIPTTGPDDDATADLIRHLRSTVIPTAVADTPVSPDHAYVTGSTAVVIDFSDMVQSRMLPFVGAVLALTFILLMMVFRSLFVPVKAVIMNLLSIGASFGVLVLIFQDGWGAGSLGIGQQVPIVVFVPVVMFAVLFGLSMDYEVFLLSRIREEYLRTGDSGEAVVSGLANTARVITSAALIMIFVFLAGSTNPAVAVKMLGLGMATAVLIDATIVRMILVPATMELMGKANWWLPKWVDKLLPHIRVD